MIDISLPISDTLPVWPGDPPVAIRQMASISQGDQANVSLIRMGVHTGTYIDSPKHFIDSGSSVDGIPLSKLIGPALVLEIASDIPLITDAVLETHPDSGLVEEIGRVLFRTRNSALWRLQSNKFQKDYVGIDSSGADWLAERNLSLIGLDYLSIAPYDSTLEPHQILLGADIVLLEGITLADVDPGVYELICLPLRIAGCEGAPARAILRNL